MASVRTPTTPDESVNLWAFGRTPGAAIDRVRISGVHLQITRNGRPAAVIVPADWWARAARLMAEHAGAEPSPDAEPEPDSGARSPDQAAAYLPDQVGRESPGGPR